MKIEVVFVGKTSDKHFGAAIDDYIGRALLASETDSDTSNKEYQEP